MNFFKNILKLAQLFLLLVGSVMLFSCLNKYREQKVESRIDNAIVSNNAIKVIAQRSKEGILICAHRSFHRNAPENSIESIKRAIEEGIDMVELDVRTTKDSVLVLMHDDSIGRTTTGSGKVNQYTFKELLQFNLKNGDSISNEKIPTLKDALDLLKESRCIANLDLKEVDYKKLHEVLKSKNMQHEVISFIGKKGKVMEMVEVDSLYAVLPLSKSKEDVLFYAENTTSVLQHFTEESFTKELMELAKKNNQLVFINTLWDEDEDLKRGEIASMDSVIALRPAIIQTDYPKMLLSHLRKRKLHK
ncbi:hypothetical protein BFP77_05795 [Maribacter sp. 4U21]|uniref:glycerophosphodiester phosphodiesterase family protein n=1 Tax=Maribacter sp. 4U21 TaxID=1889779 RepID=UPI000C14E2D9|nr:glycerophosphodiester phosphodiesterase family protein [Maribacter sp. 4U21]PIB29657.1 hypothetical protein BFP77_05795 [Maribacter sp. 4U21]